MISATVVKVVSTPVSSVGTSASPRDLRQFGGRLGCHRLAVLAKSNDQRQEPLVRREVILIELGDMGIDGLDVLAQPLPLGLQASGGVKCPDDQGSPLLRAGAGFRRQCDLPPPRHLQHARRHFP